MNSIDEAAASAAADAPSSGPAAAEIDAAAAAAAAQGPPPAAAEAAAPETAAEPEYPTLKLESSHGDVTKLVNLLIYLGYASPETHGKDVLDEGVLADVKVARDALGVPDERDQGAEVVGPVTFTALYEAAGAKLSAKGATAGA
jgi:hypothetical protein